MNVYIWGLSKKSDLLRNILNSHKNVHFKGYLSDRPQYFDSIRGAPVKLLEESVATECDAIIAVNDDWLNSKMLSDIVRKKVIDSSLFAIPDFDMEKYLKIVSDRWCIVSEDCWDGLCYKYLRMEFTSPFINTSMQSEDYYRLLAHLPECLGTVSVIEREEDLCGYAMAKCSWGGQFYYTALSL